MKAETPAAPKHERKIRAAAGTKIAAAQKAREARRKVGQIRILHRQGDVTHVILIDTRKANDGRLHTGRSDGEPGGGFGVSTTKTLPRSEWPAPLGSNRPSATACESTRPLPQRERGPPSSGRSCQLGMRI
jgi:hypothetical protein